MTRLPWRFSAAAELAAPGCSPSRKAERTPGRPWQTQLKVIIRLLQCISQREFPTRRSVATHLFSHPCSGPGSCCSSHPDCLRAQYKPFEMSHRDCRAPQASPTMSQLPEDTLLLIFRRERWQGIISSANLQLVERNLAGSRNELVASAAQHQPLSAAHNLPPCSLLSARDLAALAVQVRHISSVWRCRNLMLACVAAVPTALPRS